MRAVEPRWTVAVGLVVAIGVTFLARTVLASTGPAAQAPPAYVLNLSENMATQMGDPHPASAEFVLTTRGAAESLVADATVDSGSQPVYLVILRGNFRDRSAFGSPSESAPPTGTEINFTMDPETHSILDFGISNQALNTVSNLGTVHPFTLPKPIGRSV